MACPVQRLEAESADMRLYDIGIHVLLGVNMEGEQYQC